MGLALVVDTNVFLLVQDDVGCGQVFRRVCYSWDYMMVTDNKKEILKEYKRFAQRNRESPLHRLISLLIERDRDTTADPPFTLSINSRLTAEDKEFLCDLECHNPIEPQMLGIARGQPHTCLVLSDDRLTEPIPRGYRREGVLTIMRERFRDIRFETTGNLGWLDEPGDPAPRDHETLEAFLERNRLDENCVEREFLECKCPEPAENGVGFNLVKDIMKAVCAMTNATSGWIFIGVKDDGTICGVPKKYGGREVASWDELWRKIASQELSRFRPRKPILRQWFIPVFSGPQNDLRVIALRVDKQRGGPYRYRGEIYVREGTTSQRLNAVR